MSILLSLPALIRITIAFCFILFGIRKKLSLGTAFLLGAGVLSLLFGLAPRALVASVIGSVLDPKTLSLSVIVALILLLSQSMEQAGQMQRLLGSFRGLLNSPRLNLVVFPAIIGLLPMPGGAVFSAPMVKELGRTSRLAPYQLSFINYWFRHIWEYWWPMYPGVLLATLMADLNLLLFVVFMFPVTVFVIYMGWRPLKDIDASGESQGAPARPPIRPFLKEMLPILIVIVVGLGTGAILSWMLPSFGVAKEIGLILSLCLAIVWIWHANAFTGARALKLVIDPHQLKMIYMVAAILVFKGILTDSNAVKSISGELMRFNVPLLLIAVLLPLLVGTITGITIAFVGSTFPILIPLIHAQGEGSFMLAYMMLALVSGFAGVLISPLHLCLILSNEYFGAAMGPVYRHLVLPCACLLAAGIIYFWPLHWLCGQL